MSSTRAGPPGSSSGRSGASARPVAPALGCNLCNKPLAVTCFLCACDCVFCESCTYSHFEHSSECPTCRRRLGENDFTELVVADNNGPDISKTSMQALFSKKSSSGNLQYADLCQSLIHQIDVSKQSTKFLLKQLLVESHRAGRTGMNAMRTHESLKTEITKLKQLNSSHEQTIRELRIQLNDTKDAFEALNKYHNSGGGGGGSSGIMAPHNMVLHSSSVSIASGHAVMAQREATNQTHQNSMIGVKQTFMNNLNLHHKPPVSKLFHPLSSSSSSSGSTSTIGPGKEIQNSTANSGYHFSGGQNQNMNKRRRVQPASPVSRTLQHTMTPNTELAPNQGPQESFFSSFFSTLND